MKSATYDSHRRHMVRKLRSEGITNQLVLEAVEKIPRHIFAEPAFVMNAYNSKYVLPLTHNQTISQPYIVARMTEYLLAHNQQKQLPRNLLEIGTGSGYQTAILATIITDGSITSVERIQALHTRAQQTLRKIDHLLQLKPLLLYADGNNGHEKKSPFDAIIITACAPKLPNSLIEQLAPKGCMVLPLQKNNQQYLTIISKDQYGRCAIKYREAVRFVPLLEGTEH